MKNNEIDKSAFLFLLNKNNRKKSLLASLLDLKNTFVVLRRSVSN